MRTCDDVKNDIMNEIRELADESIWENIIHLLDELEEAGFEGGREYERENPRVVYEE